MCKRKIVLYFILFIFNQVSFAQSQKYLDSLLYIAKNAKQDSNAVNIHQQIIKIYFDQKKYDQIKYHYDLGLAIAEKIHFTKGVAKIHELMGFNEVDLKKKVAHLAKAAELFKKLGMNRDYCYSLMSIADTYSVCGNYDLAIDFQQKCLEFAQQINDQQMIAYSYDILANVYLEQNKASKTIEYYAKSIKIKQTLKVVGDLEYSYYHIALAYIQLKNYQKAIEFLEISIRESSKIKYFDNIADCYISLGYVYFLKGDIKTSIEQLDKGMKIINENKYVVQKANACNILGEVYFSKNDIEKSQSYFNEALNISNTTSSNKEKIKALRGLRKLAEQKGDYKRAYELFENEKSLIDSSNVELSARKAIQIELQLLHNNEQNIKNAEIRYQKRILNYSFVAVCILIALILLVFHNYKLKSKAKDEVEKHKDELETQSKLLYDQNLKITSSISYARRIQQAVLPSETDAKAFFSESFILFNPRDIVSGDFYFFKQVNKYSFIAAADCTGHGVPGAFMSMLGIALLNEIVLRNEFVSASQVLNELREQIKRVLQQKGLVGEQQDGMDIAFCAINSETMEMTFAGAHNPCCIFRDKTGETNHNAFEYFEFQADHQPVGIYLKEKPFTEKSFKLEKGDTLYLYSDGYPSQFGGAKNEKFKTKRFKEMLAEIHQLPMAQQKERLATNFSSWKGGLEQTDDVLVLGVRV